MAQSEAAESRREMLARGIALLRQGVEGGGAGQVEAAMGLLDEALERGVDADVQYARAAGLLYLKRSAEARRAAEEVLRLQPGHAGATAILQQLPAAKPLQRGGPRISIVTPTYNCGRYIRNCIESVLAQGYGNVEHIIVDGASTDDTLDILRQYKHLRWISEADGGEAEALNKGLKLATGQIINWLNADDLYLGTDVLATVSQAFERDKGCDVVFGNTLIINDADEVIGMRVPQSPVDLALLVRFWEDFRIFQPSMFYTRKVAETVGAYREDLYFSIDLEYWLRMAAAGFRWHHIDRTLSQARLVRSGAKSGNSRLLMERNWQEVCTPYVAMLSAGEQFNYWKEFFRYRALNQWRYNEPLDAGTDQQALAGLCFALIQLGQLPPALNVAQQLINQHPDHPEGYFFASEALCLVGQNQQAKKIAAMGMRAAETRQPLKTAPVTDWRSVDVSGQKLPATMALAVTGNAPRAAAKGRALVFCPHNPLPPQCGADQQALGRIEELARAGYAVTLFAATHTSRRPWTIQGVKRLEKLLKIRVHIYELTMGDHQHMQRPETSGGFGLRQAVPGMVAEFQRIFAELRPEVLLVTDSRYARLGIGPAFASALRVIETPRLASVQDGLRQRLWQDLGNRRSMRFGPGDVPAAWLTEDYLARIDAKPDPAELELVQQYDLALSSPSLYEARAIHNTYAGDAVLVAGEDVVNTQAYLNLASCVLPAVLRQEGRFRLRVAGTISNLVQPVMNTRLLGYLPDLELFYADARFALCPNRGTGESIKAREALAFGLPVVCYRATAEASGVEHGRNGLVADSAEQFAAHVLELWRAPALCRELGQAGRKTPVAGGDWLRQTKAA